MIDAFRFAQEISTFWGILDEGIVRLAFDTSPKIEKIEDVTAMIRRGGGKSCLITMSPDFSVNIAHNAAGRDGFLRPASASRALRF